jgi:hypothetical protein
MMVMAIMNLHFVDAFRLSLRLAKIIDDATAVATVMPVRESRVTHARFLLEDTN